MTAAKFFTHPLGIIGASVSATLLWGSSYPFIKLSYARLGIESHDTMEQILFAGYRFTLAGLLILAYMLIRKETLRYQRGSGGMVASIALFQTVLQYIFFYAGLSKSAGVVGAVIAGTISFFQIALAHFLYKNDRINGTKGLGLLVGFLGLLVLGLSKHDGNSGLHFSLGEVLLIAATLFNAIANLLSKRAAASYSIPYINGYQMLVGGIVLTVIGAWQSGLAPFHFDGIALLMLLHLALVSALAFMLWNNVMKYNSVGSVSMYLFLIPVFGVLQSAMFLSEPLSAAVLGALALVSAGIVIVNSRKRVVKADQAV
ncbi:DMT family transporter [Paenibacillus sp. CF384]|uniref:DMT family transporter n=1 Tax=Paenibacillus sp. CF384 TaxID=1884382 RepID=UPI0008950C23|nr:DMT family transporter [Paenibacillus sp. CF384]SDW55609.1 Permease of the drug/metabolite transporter (DMT) superfamily [Paenibacillus sp. CF384]